MTNELTKALQRALIPPGDLSDGRLLDRFVADRDEAAFEALVRRHGPLVLGVCRRVLRDAHDAEDAFQATFLLLARKAASVVKRNSVGGWLYRVAYHVALEARAVVARRRARERQVDDMPHPEVAPPEPQDWRPVLDRELARLPEKYRVPVVLFHLEGRPHREVARELGLPEGTLSSRLSTARQMLARRLARSGVALPAALAVALSESALSAAPPVALVNSTVRAALLLAAGETVLATPATSLMKGALQTMFMRKMKVVTATAVVLLTLGVGGLAYRAGGQTAPAERPGPKKPLTELEALRRENQLLKLNLEVVLEKVAALDGEVRDLRRKAKVAASDAEQQRDRAAWAERMAKKGFLTPAQADAERARLKSFFKAYDRLSPMAPESNRAPRNSFEPLKPGTAEFGKFQADLVRQAEDALRALREGGETEQRKAADALERALRSLKGKEKPRGR